MNKHIIQLILVILIAISTVAAFSLKYVYFRINGKDNMEITKFFRVLSVLVLIGSMLAMYFLNN